jgi:hypothetical protein
MNKIFQLLLAAILLPGVLAAQVTITAADVAPIGFKGFQSRDSLPEANLQPGGTGLQSWDFTSLKDMSSDTLLVLNPESTPYSGQFDGAAFAVRRNSDLYIYFSKNDDALRLQGVSGKQLYQGFVVQGSLKFSPQQTLLAFPTNADSEFSENVTSTVQVPGSAIGSTFDSLRLRSFISRNIKFDAYGELKTPAGVYDALRATEIEASYDSVYIFSSGIWFPLQATESDTIVYYNWWTNTGALSFPVVQIESRTNGEIKLVSWLRDVVSGVNDRSIGPAALSLSPNPASDLATVLLPGARAGWLEVIDQQGRLCLKQTISSERETIALSGLTAGIHLVVWKGQDGGVRGFSRLQIVR